MTVRDSITRTGARTPGVEVDPTSKAAHDQALGPTQCGSTDVDECAKGGRKPNISRCMPGAGLNRLMCGKAPPYMPACQPYRGKPAVRNDREGRGNVGIIRSPVRASTLPDCGGREVTRVPTATAGSYAWDRSAPKPSAIPPAAWQRPRPDAEIDGGEASLRPPRGAGH